MKKNITIVALFFATACSVQAQSDFEMWYKISPEIRLNIENKPWEFRWRPDDHIILPKKYSEYIGQHAIGRTDIMLGANVGRFKIFNYSKFDELGGIWTGLRLDYNTTLFNKKILLNIQERLFWGLNENSENHYYLVQFAQYRVTKKFNAGILCYGKWEFERPLSAGEDRIPFSEGHWFIGPSVFFKLPANFSLMLVEAKDILNENIYMTFFRLGYRIKIKTKNKLKND
ncbi:MAG: hypothetical protein U9N85_11865 [Bacteroidota bacterium]|nr:hypothetical protein [Bacteroidota bacterium]